MTAPHLQTTRGWWVLTWLEKPLSQRYPRVILKYPKSTSTLTPSLYSIENLAGWIVRRQALWHPHSVPSYSIHSVRHWILIYLLATAVVRRFLSEVWLAMGRCHQEWARLCVYMCLVFVLGESLRLRPSGIPNWRDYRPNAPGRPTSQTASAA